MPFVRSKTAMTLNLGWTADALYVDAIGIRSFAPKENNNGIVIKSKYVSAGHCISVYRRKRFNGRNGRDRRRANRRSVLFARDRGIANADRMSDIVCTNMGTTPFIVTSYVIN